MKVGRNSPCPCGSGLKYKRCCLPNGPRSGYTRDERESALAKLEQLSEYFAEDDEQDDAYEEFWQSFDGDEEWLDEHWARLLDDAFDAWLYFDRPLGAGGERLVDLLLARDRLLSAGERRFLELARDTLMLPYEVVDVLPGMSLTLRGLLDSAEVTVHERLGSRQLKPSDLLAARVIRRGPSGQPELERGLLPLPGLLRSELVSDLTAKRAAFRRERVGAPEQAFYAQLPPYFGQVCLTSLRSPPIPALRNTDGDPLALTRVHFSVSDTQRLTGALDAASELEREREEGRAVWLWCRPRPGDKKAVSGGFDAERTELGRFELRGEKLSLQTNSAARAERGRALLEALVGELVVYRASTHEDLARAVRERIVAGGAELGEKQRADQPTRAGIPAEVAEALILDKLARYYRGWLDEAIPALEGRTPRAAAKDPAQHDAVEQLVRELEGMYLDALRRGEPAYDPSWMRAELGLPGSAQRDQPPPLAHERWDELLAGFGEVSRAVAERARAAPGFDDGQTTLTMADLRADLEARRSIRQGSAADGEGRRGASGGRDARERRLLAAANHELHRRKTFWVDEGLSYLLGQTDLDVSGELLRLPFASFALVFTDRLALSLAERAIASGALRSEAASPESALPAGAVGGDTREDGPLAGHLLRVLTVYVREQTEGDSRILRLGFAVDALGADPPQLYEQQLVLREGVRLELQPREPVAEIEGLGPILAARPLPDLLQIVLNAILYATSAGAETRERLTPRGARRGKSVGEGAPRSDAVYFLPGKIPITQLRRLQELGRAPSGRQLLSRFMVRGHWRRPAQSWKDQRMRWIEPYWKGPDLAAVIERTYQLSADESPDRS